MELTEPRDIADSFNLFFTAVATQYVNDNWSDDGSSLLKLKQFISSKLPTDVCFNIPEVSVDYVTNSLIHLNSNKATGLDEISARLLKDSAREVSPCVAHIINTSIRNSVFPSSWKIAKVIPIFKSGSSLDVSNYRPISILSVLSKILEKHVHAALYKFLNKYNLLRNAQSGFREKHRTKQLS